MAVNLPARVAGDWFPSHERDVATVIATMSNVAGQMVFSLLPPLLVHTPEQLGLILLVQLPACVLVTAAAWTLLAERPPSPPSASAAQRWREAKSNDAIATLLHDVRMLLANGNFVLLASGFAIGTGTVWAVLILEGQFITPCGYSDAIAGAAGAALLGAGILAAFGLGAVLESTKAYLPLQRGVMAAAVLTTALALTTARPGSAALLLIAYCALGCALQPLNPITLEHAAEMTFPLSPEVSSSVLYMFANTFAFALVFVLTPLLALPVSAQCTTVFTPAAATILGCMAAGLAFTCAVRKDYRRSACEHRSDHDSQEAPLLSSAADGAYGTAAD
jgi:FLVCR family MFS transporter 7